MRYAKSYIDKYFNLISEYHSKVELFHIAYTKFEETQNNSLSWIIELGEIINWQAMSERSGVWTYYEMLDNGSAQILIDSLKIKNEREILDKYCVGIGNYADKDLMNDIDKWINKNEMKIYRYIEDILIENRNWFYSALI